MAQPLTLSCPLPLDVTDRVLLGHGSGGKLSAALLSEEGEPEKALSHLEPLLNRPFILSKEWLKIDPTFDSLRGNPRFQKLVAGN